MSIGHVKVERNLQDWNYNKNSIPQVKLLQNETKYPKKVHLITDCMVEGTNDKSWNEVWYVSIIYKFDMCPRRVLFNEIQYKFKMIGK